MKASKLLKTICGAALIAGTLISCPKKSNADFYLWGSIQGNGHIADTVEKRTAKIKHVPEDIRNVPKHPADTYAKDKNVAPISDSEFTLPLINEGGSAEINLGAGFRKGVFDFRLGGILTSYATIIKDSSELSDYNNPDYTDYRLWLGNFPIKERNYTNYPGTDKRGYGAALTYYGFNSHDAGGSYGLSARTSLIFDLSKDPGVISVKPFAEYSVLFSPTQYFFIETGWDRYNSLQRKDTYKVTSGLLNHIVKAGVNFSVALLSLELYYGLEIPKIMKKTPLADETGFNLDLTRNHFIGFSAGVYFDTSFIKYISNPNQLKSVNK